MNAQYRMNGRSLFRLEGNAYIHCAIVPASIKTLKAAVEWFEHE